MVPDWKTLPSLASLRAFELTARSGNFAAAARALNVTHAAIAQRVRALEEDLGVPLVRRAGRSVVLTEAGKRLAQHLSEGFGIIADGVGELRQDQSRSPVQIAATVYIAQAAVLPKLHEFWKLHPEIQVSVLPSQETVDIAALGFDLAIRGGPADAHWPGLIAEPLLESDLIAVGAPSLVQDGMVPPDQLPWIWSPGVAFEEMALAAFGLDATKLKNVDIGVPSLQLSLARQGLGLSFTTEVLVRDELAAGVLHKLPLPSPFAITYYAVTPVGPVRPQARAFIDWLKKTLGAPG
ncbi:LysR family transcriptional regulator [Celeribacter neptunius]|uniref:LysR family transcriptional regulator, glycine cleavage system transcriptional activator n=1 Tax=Celeribacter neptunius TaxID=588602 RepID=A0A1I3LPR5_9RHOB|nr:LysR substrate-binding domain-containing protein [Celeribacter neptunius]SFI86707.1 LysR family transcriptional regulator, glycine cleavage system transcriptional activator [Celeribacter neptunius]